MSHEVDHQTAMETRDLVDENPDMVIDIADEAVTFGDSTVGVTVDEGQWMALVDGIWDTTVLMNANQNEIRKSAASPPYIDSPD